MKILEQAIVDVLATEPYYGYLLLNMQKHITNKVPTAGVNVKDGVVNLFINPEFFSKQKRQHRKGILIHECMHITNAHIVRRKEDVSMMDYNIAADAAINQYIRTLETFPTASFADQKQGKIMPESIAPDLRKGETAEYYLEHLQKNKKNYPQQGEGQESLNGIDDHSIWEQGETNADAVKEVLRKTLKNAKDQTLSTGCGNVPGEVEQLLDELNKSLVGWKQVLRMFFASVSANKKEKTRKRRNRRYGIAYPGKKKEPETKLAIAVDTSGSVSDEELNLFFSEIRSLASLVDEVYIIQCDAEVTDCILYKGKTPTVKGRGGTNFGPSFKKAEELGVDGLIYFTDGGCFDTFSKPKYPVLWALTKYGSKPVEWGNSLCLSKG